MKYVLVLLLGFLFIGCSTPPQSQTFSGSSDMGSNILTGVHMLSTQSGSQKPYGDDISPDFLENSFLYDFESDDSYQKFVNPEVSFQDISYIPEDLEKISGEFIIDSKGNQTLRKETVENLHLLGEAFFQEFSQKLVVVSAYRSYSYQKGIKDRGCSDLYCAKAGHSEHQSGLAFDMFEATNEQTFLSKSHLKKYFEWMNENAHLYGFHNTYQKGREIDGYAVEPWHWRYVGIELATELKNQGKTFAEFVNQN